MLIRTYPYTSMEAGRNLLTSSLPIPPQTQQRNLSYCSSSVLMLHEQSARSLPFLATTSVAQHFPTSVLLQEQRDEGRPLLSIMREDKARQVTLEKTQEESESPAWLKDLEHWTLNLPGLCYLLPSLQYGDITSCTMRSVLSKTKRLMDVESHSVVALAKKALSASNQAALLAEDLLLFGTEVGEFRTKVDEFQTSCSTSTSFSNFPLVEVKTIRSTRLPERQSKKRRGPNPKVMVQETRNPPRKNSKRNLSKPYYRNNAVRLFMRGAKKKQLLTVEEESELIAQIQGLARLEEVKSRLQSQIDRELKMVEWASAVGLSCQALQWQIHCGNSSRKRLIYANFRMVLHIAKQYCGRGVDLEDLLQEGSRGLMRSVDKYKPQGNRFASYAYIWIKQAIRKAIFDYSRIIRLPESAYALQNKVNDAKRLCIQEGNHYPTKEDIATRVGMTVEKLNRFLFSIRMPVSIDKPIWTDQDTTYQEITADPAIENPEVFVEKQLMRQHVRKLILSTLTPREQTVIRLRFGLEGANRKKLSEIGDGFGLSKEMIRQVQNKALSKLKQSISSQDAGAYADLIR